LYGELALHIDPHAYWRFSRQCSGFLPAMIKSERITRVTGRRRLFIGFYPEDGAIFYATPIATSRFIDNIIDVPKEKKRIRIYL